MAAVLLWEGGTWLLAGARGYTSDLASGCTENLENKGNENFVARKDIEGSSRYITSCFHK
jgi:hypothetical protein